MARSLRQQAHIDLTLNAKQPSKMLDDQRKKVEDLRKKLVILQNTNASPKMIKNVQKELTNAEQKLKLFEAECKQSLRALKNLDKASLADLNMALKTLKKGLDNIPRGTAQWKAHAEKIRQVQTQINSANASLRAYESRWQRINRWLNNAQTAIMGSIAALTGLIMAGRKAVNAYAEMEEKMANTRKYTGMSVEDVERLNNAFKRMDTRVGREQLNLLAQEGGRLGKKTLDDVKDYVEAAQIINVALVDLGEGATQTIAKLTNIFGVDQLLGTKQAMLSVGSAVNVLSQNCTASKPYLVNFAQRMAGIGAQAGLTIPQILAFGAVLDANGQKVEMSATALQKVIMNLANKNHEFAATVGLDAEKLNETLKVSAKDGILMFLEALKKIGDSSSYDNATMVLAPALKDMKLDAARVSQVLGVLAMHLDEIKWQLGNADQAFQEATSATREFNIFNNTAQASIEKAKARVHELAVELGEKLYPVMRHIMTSSSFALRTLNKIVDFIIKNRVALLSLITAIVTYNIVLNITAIKTTLVKAASTALAMTMGVLKGAVILAQAAFALLTGNIQKARAMMRLFNMTLHASPWGVVFAAVAALSVAIYSLTNKTKEYKEALDKVENQSVNLTKQLKEEVDEIGKLIGKMKGAKEGSEEYNKAKNEIISKYGLYLRGLINEKGEIIDLSAAYDRLTDAVYRSQKARGLQNTIDNLGNTYFEQIDNLTQKLVKRLKDMGMDSTKAYEIVTRITQDLVSNKDINRNDILELIHFSNKNKGFMDIFKESPLEIINDLKNLRADYNQRVAKLEGAKGKDLFDDFKTENLQKLLDFMGDFNLKGSPDSYSINLKFSENSQKMVKALTSVDGVNQQDVKINEDGSINLRLSKDNTESITRQILYSLGKRNIKTGGFNSSLAADEYSDDGDDDNPDPQIGVAERDKQRRKEAAEAAAKLRKEKAEFQEGLKKIKAQEIDDIKVAFNLKNIGAIDYLEFLEQKRKAEEKFFDDSIKFYEDNLSKIKDYDLQDDKDYQNLQLKKLETMEKYQSKVIARQASDIRRMAQFELNELDLKEKYKLDKTTIDEIKYQEKKLAITIEYLQKEQDLYEMTSEEWENLQLKIEDELEKAMLEKRKTLINSAIDFEKKFFKQSAAEIYAQYKKVVDYLKNEGIIADDKYQKIMQNLKREEAEALRKEKNALPGYSASQSEKQKNEQYLKQYEANLKKLQEALGDGIINEDELKAAAKACKSEYIDKVTEGLKKCGSEWVSMLTDMSNAWVKFFEHLGDDDMLKNLGSALSTSAAMMAAIFSQVTQYAQAELEIQVKAVEDRYEKEIERAQGNSRMVATLEKKKEEEVAKIKEEANNKMFAMQVIQAIAQTAASALNAYSSAAAIPVVGHIIAPIAAALATAQGMAQVALIKKQQQAAAASGYAEGGYTPEGGKYEVAGVVHKGEWVASQKLLNSPVTAPIIEMLDRAQRSNSLASLSLADSNYFAGHASLPMANNAKQEVIVNVNDAENKEMMRQVMFTIMALNKRLDEPFITVNTMNGDKGIKKAQDDYNRYLRNGRK